MSGPPRGDKWERDLRDRMTESGWAVTRAAGSGTWSGDSVDIVGVRNGEVLMLEVKSTHKNFDSISVTSDDPQLRRIRDKATEDDTDNVRVGYVVYIKNLKRWYFVPCGRQKITPDDLQTKLYEVTI